MVERFGRIDILVNNASNYYKTPFETLTEEQWDDLVGTNLKGTFLVCKRVGDEMLKTGAGKIIEIKIAKEAIDPNDPMAINRNFLHSIGLVGDAKMILASLVRLLREKDFKAKVDQAEHGGAQHIEEETLRSGARHQARRAATGRPMRS